MASLEQVVAYLTQHRDRYPFPVLKATLLKQGIPEELVDQAVARVTGASLPPPPPVSRQDPFPFRTPSQAEIAIRKPETGDREPVDDSPSKPPSSGELTRYQKAGRIYRVVGWLGVVALVGVAAAVALPIVAGGRAPRPGGIVLGLAITAFIGTLAWFNLYVGKAIHDHKDWARIAGIVMGVLHLPGFPVGTLVGAYVLWCLITGWEDVPAGDAG